MGQRYPTPTRDLLRALGMAAGLGGLRRGRGLAAEQGHQDMTRVDTMQRKFLREGNFDLHLPLKFSVYGDDYSIPAKQ